MPHMLLQLPEPHSSGRPDAACTGATLRLRLILLAVMLRGNLSLVAECSLFVLAGLRGRVVVLKRRISGVAY
jgi:hypothetical protein